MKPFPRLIQPKPDSILKVNTNNMIQSGAPSLQANFASDTTVVYTKYSNDVKFVNCRKTVDVVAEEPPLEGLKIFIDTSYAFHAKGFLYEYEAYPYDSSSKTDAQLEKKIQAYFDKQRKLKGTYVSAYPVLFYNSGGKELSLYVAAYDEFKFIQEARDTDGKWKPIEFWETLPSCIGGTNYLTIAPKHYAASAVVKYHGNFKTKLRVKMMIGGKTYYSNSVVGYINRSQFNQDFVKEVAQHWHLRSLMPEDVTAEHIRRKKHFIFLEPTRFEWHKPISQ